MAILAGLLGCAGSSCFLGGITTQSTTALTEADHGRTVGVRVGERVALRLHENASTGYRWAFDDFDTNVVGVSEDKHVPHTAAVGSGGDVQWILEPRAPGTTQVRLKLLRPWEGDSSIKKRFAVTLVIQA